MRITGSVINPMGRLAVFMVMPPPPVPNDIGGRRPFDEIRAWRHEMTSQLQTGRLRERSSTVTSAGRGRAR